MHLDTAQKKVKRWVRRCFGEQAIDVQVRSLRLLEEAIEFAHATGVDMNKVGMLTRYVYERARGEIKQELGGVGVTWLAACESINENAGSLLTTEIDRIHSKPPAYFRERNQAKIAAGFK